MSPDWPSQDVLRPDAFPYRTALGYRYDSGDYPALLDAALRLADDAGFAARRAASAARGLRRGNRKRRGNPPPGGP